MHTETITARAGGAATFSQTAAIPQTGTTLQTATFSQTGWSA